MSNDNFQHELDDELLSAYLDGELSEEERAAVDARLASDPEAQHLLHQLRATSQAVQMTPLESVGRDLSGEILRRVEAKLPADKVERAATVDARPKVTIFQTRRAWVWASLAMAAGLMIMVLQSSEDKNKNLTAVAERSSGAAAKRELDQSIASDSKKSESATAIDPAKVALNDSVATVAAPGAPPEPVASTPAAPMEKPSLTPQSPAQTFDKLVLNGQAAKTSNAPTSTRDGGDLNGQLSAGPSPKNTSGKDATAMAGAPSPAPASVTLGVRSDSRVASGNLDQPARAPSAAPAAANSGFSGGRALGGPGGRATEAPTQNDALVIVHVVAKPEAIQSRAFDKLLASEGISLEANPRSEMKELDRSAANGVAHANKSDADRAALADESTAKSAENNEDMVLVDAPRQTVASFLAGLKQDSANYVGVEVEEPAQAADRANVNEPLDKEMVADWGQYNRGVVTPQQKDAFRNRFNYYAAADDAQKQSSPLQQRDLQAFKESKQESGDEAPRPQDIAQSQNRSRALRLSLADAEAARSKDQLGAGGGGGIGPDDMKAPLAMRRAQGQSTAAAPTGELNDNVQVLFVVSPDRAAATIAPTKKAAQ